MNNLDIDLEEILSHYNDTINSLEILVEHTEKEPYLKPISGIIDVIKRDMLSSQQMLSTYIYSSHNIK